MEHINPSDQTSQLPDNPVNKEGLSLKGWTIIGFCLVVAFALSVRLFYIHESSKSITFENPVIDAATYNVKAIDLAEKGLMDSEFFWQQFFYPFYLSGVYYCFGSSIIVAKIIQAILGAMTCGLTFIIGKKLFNFTAGIIAAFITAVYGPLIFQEAELIAAGFTAFWAVLLVLLFLKAKDKPTFKLFFLLGIVGALSTLTRPNFLLFFGMSATWLVMSCLIAEWSKKAALTFKVLLLIIGFALTVSPVSYLNYKINGNLSFLPASGGCNLYIGNNPDFDAAQLRPGYKWESMVNVPVKYGYKDDIWEKQKFFIKEVKGFFVSDPVRFIKGLISKDMQLLSSREMPGNVDVYLFRDSSKLLSCLMWKYGNFGFPFGVLLPLAVLGICLSWRRLSPPLLLFLLMYSLPLIFTHIESRYRMALIPLLAIAAGQGVLSLRQMLISQRWMPLAASMVFMSTVVLGATIPGPFVSETLDYLPELHLRIGVSLKDKGLLTEAMEHYDRAIELNPQYAEAYYSKGAMLYYDGQIEESIANFEKTLEFEPQDSRAYNNLGSAYGSMGKLEKAASCFEKTLELSLNDYDAFMNLAKTYIMLKSDQQAIEVYSEALKYYPDNLIILNNLASLYRRRNLPEQARVFYEKSVELAPDDPQQHYYFASFLSTYGTDLEIESQYQAVLRLDPDFLQAHLDFASFLVKQGKTQQGLDHFKKALAIQPANFDIRFNIGLILAQLERYAESVDEFEILLAQYPQNADLHAIVGELLLKMGGTQQAIDEFRKALKINPDHNGAKSGLEEIFSTRRR